MSSTEMLREETFRCVSPVVSRHRSSVESRGPPQQDPGAAEQGEQREREACDPGPAEPQVGNPGDESQCDEHGRGTSHERPVEPGPPPRRTAGALTREPGAHHGGVDAVALPLARGSPLPTPVPGPGCRGELDERDTERQPERTPDRL